MSCCSGKGVSVWRNSMWECSDCGAARSNDPDYLYGNKPLTQPTWTPKTTKVCTCGAEKTYGASTGHSSWCDKNAK
ncbi:MAG: hypothetical protein NVS1B10_03150 [Candidatus Saccharimonadales bacterium]